VIKVLTACRSWHSVLYTVQFVHCRCHRPRRPQDGNRWRNCWRSSNTEECLFSDKHTHTTLLSAGRVLHCVSH